MDPFSLSTAVLGIAQTCFKLGPDIINECKTWKKTDREVEERIGILEGSWHRTQQQVDFVTNVVSILDDEILSMLCSLLHDLRTSLQDAQNKVYAVIKKDGTFSFSFKPKKASLVRKREAISTNIADLEAWQRRFEFSWYLLMKTATPLIDNELSKRKGTLELQNAEVSPDNPLALAPGLPNMLTPDLSRFKSMCLSELPNEWRDKPYEVAKSDAFEVAGPETSHLPPPPELSGRFDCSPSNNASEQEAEEGEKWCKRHRYCDQIHPGQEYRDAIRMGNIKLLAPKSFQGTLTEVATGVWKGSSDDGCPYTCIASSPPLYSVTEHLSWAKGRGKMIYYEVNILSQSRREVSLALGYNVSPYPPFRLPGWHRGSVAVHGDDGRKYINDRWGGKSFTGVFKPGETLGIGVDLSPSQDGFITTEIFFTRDGTEAGRWDLNEDTDLSIDQPITGLQGFHDLCAAVGVFDAVSFEVVFAPNRWKWKGLAEQT